MVSSFSNIMADAEVLYTHIGDPKKRGELEAKLKEASGVLKKSKEHCDIDKIARLHFLSGRCQYARNYPVALRDFQISIYAQFQKQFKEESPTSVEVEIVEKTDAFVKRALSLGSHTAFQVAQRVRWMGFCYQNMDSYNTATEKNLRRLKCVYGAAMKILDGIETDDKKLAKNINWELCDIVYNTERKLLSLAHKLKHGGGKQRELILSQIKAFALLQPYFSKEGETLRKTVREAQVHNMRAILYDDLAKHSPKEKDKYFDLMVKDFNQAIAIAEKTEGFDLFLKHMFYNNKVAFAMKGKVEDYHELQEYANKAIAYAKSDHNKHAYYILYYCNAGHLELKLGNKKQAEEHFKTAKAIFEKSKESQNDFKASLAKLEKALKG